MSEREAELRAFHERRPGITSRHWARGGTYERLAACAEPGERVLDLGCGDAHLLALLAARGASGVGLDLAPYPPALRACPHPAEAEESPRLVQGRAQQLPFANDSFDLVVCHLAFMLFDDIEQVVAEIMRVSDRFAAILGGGPIADDDPPDAFHTFLKLAQPRAFAAGDRRARTPAGWRSLFNREPHFERIVVDLSGSLAEVTTFLTSNYGVDRDIDLRPLFPTDPVPCRAVVELATIRR